MWAHGGPSAQRKTWVLRSGSALRPGPPPAFGLAALEAEMQELRDFQRTPQSNATAFFWQYCAGGARAYASFGAAGLNLCC